MKRGYFKRKTKPITPSVRAYKPRRRTKTSKPSSVKLKKELDALFSKYIRLKYSKNGFVSCYTCGKVLTIQSAQNGHFVRRQYLATRFSEDNCRPQCIGCNIFGDGKTVEFAKKLEEEKQGIVQELYKQAQQIVKDFPYEEKIKEYEEKLKSYQQS